MKPYLVLPGIVEIDETKIGVERGVSGAMNWHPKLRWVFGMYCRQTGLIIMYYILNRMSEFLYPKIKKHVRPGTVMISDELATYVSI